MAQLTAVDSIVCLNEGHSVEAVLGSMVSTQPTVMVTQDMTQAPTQPHNHKGRQSPLYAANLGCEESQPSCYMQTFYLR